MRDMGMEMGDFARLDSVLSREPVMEGLQICEGGCGRFVLGRFCGTHELMNAQMEAKRLADGERTKLYERMMRTQVGVVEMPEPRQVPFTENPLAQAVVGLVVLIVSSAAFWFGLPYLVTFGLWVSSK